MATERTLSILKPDALESGVIGKILTRLEEAGLKPVAMKMLHLTQREAEGFYAVHRERPFFRGLVQYMTSGPVVLTCLERDNAVAMLREVIGATDPAQAASGTIRKLYGESKGRNTVHASDSPASAEREVKLFFGVAALAR